VMVCVAIRPFKHLLPLLVQLPGAVRAKYDCSVIRLQMISWSYAVFCLLPMLCIGGPIGSFGDVVVLAKRIQSTWYGVFAASEPSVPSHRNSKQAQPPQPLSKGEDAVLYESSARRSHAALHL